MLGLSGPVRLMASRHLRRGLVHAASPGILSSPGPAFRGAMASALVLPGR